MSGLLLPAENMALTVARAQAERGENPTQNISVVLVMALDRLIAALDNKVLYEIDPKQSAMQDTRLVRQAINQGVLVQVWPDVTP